MQPKCGFDGQLNACWNHSMSREELETIRTAGFRISVIHGRYSNTEDQVLSLIIWTMFLRWLIVASFSCRHDVIAQLSHAKRLAEKLYPSARMVELNGGHLVSHERTEEVRAIFLFISVMHMMLTRFPPLKKIRWIKLCWSWSRRRKVCQVRTTGQICPSKAVVSGTYV